MEAGSRQKDGRESVAGIVLMIRRKRKTGRAGEKKVEINKAMQFQRVADRFYDRTDLVEKRIQRSQKYWGSAILVIVILYLFLRNIRGALVVTVTLPLPFLPLYRHAGLTVR
jgi:cobalt-zinc-cadmium resistance protein CzcA